jgi:hypothetical protein
MKIFEIIQRENEDNKDPMAPLQYAYGPDGTRTALKVFQLVHGKPYQLDLSGTEIESKSLNGSPIKGNIWVPENKPILDNDVLYQNIPSENLVVQIQDKRALSQIISAYIKKVEPNKFGQKIKNFIQGPDVDALDSDGSGPASIYSKVPWGKDPGWLSRMALTGIGKLDKKFGGPK